MIFNLIKTAASLVIGVGVSAVATNVIKATTPQTVSKIMKVCIGAGTLFISGVASAAASDNFDKKMDNVKNIIDKVKQTLKERKEEKQKEKEEAEELLKQEEVKKEEESMANAIKQAEVEEEVFKQKLKACRKEAE